MTKLCSFCLRQSLPVAKNKTENTCLLKKRSAFSFCLFQSCLFLQVSKMEEAKNKQTRSEVFFSFCQGNNTVVQDNKTCFCFTVVQNQQAFGLKKKQLFFLACLRSWEVTFLKQQKKCEHQRFVTKSNGQFHFFVTPIYQVMIVITNFNVFEHPPTQV